MTEWRLVPVEPTPEMEWAANNHHSLPTAHEDHRISIYRAMLAAAPQPPAAQEPDAWLFQHEETGLTQCVDHQQVEWGFERNNPRWQKIRPLYVHPAPADDRVRELEEDRARLDWLDSVNLHMNERNGSVYGWKYDINHNRASLTDHNLPALTIREAIDCARFPEKAGEIISASVKEGARRADFDRRFPGVSERARAALNGGK